MRANQITDFSRYKGFNFAEQHPVMLQSGRQIHDTTDWNPFTYALVLDKPNLLQYILQTVIRLDELLAIGIERDSCSNPKWNHQDILRAQLRCMLLIAENNLQNFSLILNQLHYKIENKLLEDLIPAIARVKQGPKLIETILSTHAFHSLFYSQVKTNGLLTVANSFQKFYVRYLQGANCSKASGNALIQCLSKAPYNFAFGAYLCSDYQKNTAQFKKHQTEKLMSQCAQFELFDMYHVCGAGLSIQELEFLKTRHEQCKPFVTACKSKNSSLASFGEKINTLLTTILKGDLTGLFGLKKQIQSLKIPNGALHLIKGFDSPMTQNLQVKGVMRDFPIDTKPMNVLELACALKQPKIVQFLLAEFNLVSIKDVQSMNMIAETPLLLIPIMRKDIELLRMVFQSNIQLKCQEIKDVLGVCKDVSWTEGIECVLKSRVCAQMFTYLTHKEQNAFLWWCYCLPHIDDEKNQSQSELKPKTTMTPTPQPQELMGFETKRSLTFQESQKLLLRKAIQICLVQNPYTLSSFMMAYVQKPNGLPEVPADDMWDIIEFLIDANGNITDVDINQYVIASNGMLLKILEKGYQLLRVNTNLTKQDSEELREYKAELMFLMKRIQNHPSNDNYHVKITVESESDLRLDMNVADETIQPTLEKGSTQKVR